MDEDASFDFNFWTAFADMMLALVLVLVLLISIIIIGLSYGKVNLDKVKANQNNIVDTIAEKYGTVKSELPDIKDAYGIKLLDIKNCPEIQPSANQGNDIEFYNDLDKQRITFSEWILFDSGRSEIKCEGRDVLKTIAQSIIPKLELIKQIQIEGHADIVPPRGISNVQLGANRAINVFTFLKDEVGINPAEHLMSATTFGEFNSVQRVRNAESYNWNKIQEDNKDDQLKGKNRRIEIVLFYWRKQ